VIQIGIQLGRVVERERAEEKWNRLATQLRHHLQETRDARFRYEEEAAAHAHLAKELALAKDEMQTAFEKSEESEQRYRVLVEHSPVGIWQVAPDGKIVFANSALCALLEVEGIKDIIGKSYRSFLSPESVPIVDRECANWSQGIASTCEATFIGRRSRENRHVEISGAPLSSADGQVLNALSTVVDLTERKDAEALIRKLALNDPLTGLANRNLFQRRLELALQNARRSDHSVALMFLDLDSFKNVNDSFGHPIGDALLKEVGERLVKSVREIDTVARLGGDEFAVVAANFGDIETIHAIAARIIDCIKEPFVLDGVSITSGTSIGISFFPHDAMETQDLIKNADLALYQAKTRGRGVYQLYDEKLHAEVKARMGLERDLRLALERGEFVLHYQPQLDLANHDLVGVEALIRWQHPERGLIPPGKFISVAEAVGLIAPLGEWVLEAACKQNKAWHDAGLPPFRVAVNVSADQFNDSDFVTKIEAILEEAQMDPRLLELEITEGAVVDGSDEVVERLHRLSELGTQIAIDDFGTGYSSLAYLKKFPIHRLKIDQSFVKDLMTHPDLAAITDAVIKLGHSLNLKVTAEGVETEEHVAYLRGQGCDEAQGYHYSRPLPAEKLAEWVAERYNIEKTDSVPLRGP
jgi:diguanylate cyclase (GGDEF)-like protein/PAS domain S-box-containing protein